MEDPVDALLAERVDGDAVAEQAHHAHDEDQEALGDPLEPAHGGVRLLRSVGMCEVYSGVGGLKEQGGVRGHSEVSYAQKCTSRLTLHLKCFEARNGGVGDVGDPLLGI